MEQSNEQIPVEQNNISNNWQEPENSDDIMKDTEHELKKFTTYTLLFNMCNPRQLTRLRNSYRLLKNLYQDDDPIQLMFMLFFCEMIDSNNLYSDFKKDRVILDKKLFNDKKFIEDINEELEELNKSDKLNYNLLATKVRQCILPRLNTNKIEVNKE